MAKNSLQKNCINCNTSKNINLFYKHNGMSDGHLNKCIDCCKEYAKNRRITCEAPRINDAKRYYKSDARKLQTKKNSKAWHSKDENKKIRVEKLREYRALYPEKYKARTIVKSAIRNGSLIKENCSICGKHNAHAHHPNYSEPLKVVWLCSSCHGKEHRKYDVEKLFEKGCGNVER